jgi:acetolactate synthase small subunit
MQQTQTPSLFHTLLVETDQEDLNLFGHIIHMFARRKLPIHFLCFRASDYSNKYCIQLTVQAHHEAVRKVASFIAKQIGVYKVQTIQNN